MLFLNEPKKKRIAFVAWLWNEKTFSQFYGLNYDKMTQQDNNLTEKRLS